MLSGSVRRQNTICRPVDVAGIGFFGNADVRVRFLPAPASHGIVFQRIDLPDAPLIPAIIANAVPGHRRTVLDRHGVRIEMIEHAMAALGGLQIDNCLVQVDAPELPGLDGSSLEFASRLLDAEITELDETVLPLTVNHRERITDTDGDGGGDGEIRVEPVSRPVCGITYQLDYGDRSPFTPQMLSVEITPETFVREIAFARTFILESEVTALRARGYGQRTTAADLLVIAPDGNPIENRLRIADEFVRHKILDCIGDFALAGTDIIGHVRCWRSGHNLNRLAVQRLQEVAQRPLEGSENKEQAA